MQVKELKIIVDQRERNTELTDRIEASGVLIDVKTLPIGDYIISERVCIERKTVSDFENSIISGRLFDQITRMKETYKSPILLIEGDQDTFRLKHKVINGAIAAIFVDYGIQIVFSLNEEMTADIIESIARHEKEGRVRGPSPKGAARAYTQEQFQEYMVGNLPGVGEKISKTLLKHFGNIKNLANASVEELMQVDKIGKKKAERIYGTLNGRYIH